MKIKSPFQDYYDGVGRSNPDKDTFWIRKPTVEEVKYEGPNLRFPDTRYGRSIVQDLVIGFCGKYYPLVHIQGYTGRNLNEYVDKIIYDKEIALPNQSYSPAYRRRFLTLHNDNFFDYFTNPPQNVLDWHQKFGPIFLVSSRNQDIPNTPEFPDRNHILIIKNICLQNLGFMKIIPATEAYWECYRWIINQANPEKPIPQMDNQTKIDLHGFDKFSFRKQKEDKK